MPNEKEKEKKQGENQRRKLDASRMSAAEILEAVGAAEPLEDSLVHARRKKQQEEQAQNARNSSEAEPASKPGSVPDQNSNSDSDIQKKIALIQQQKQEKLKQAQEKLNANRELPVSPGVSDSEPEPGSDSDQNPDSSVQEQNAEKQMTQVRKVRVRAVTTPTAMPTPEESEPVLKNPESPDISENAEKSEKKSSEKSGKSKKSIFSAKMGAILGVAGAGVLLLIYLIGAFHYQEKFLPHTYINSFAVAGMTREEAHNALLEQKQAKDLTLITAKGEQVVIPAQDFQAEYTIPAGAFNEAVNESNFNWVSKLFSSSEYAIPYEYSYSEEALRSLIESHDWGSGRSQNAKIVRADSGKFEITPETTGDQFDTGRLMRFIVSELAAGKNVITMEDSGCYEPYKAKVTSQDLQEDLAVYNQYAECNVTYDFDDRKITLDSDTIISWLLTKPDGSFVTTSGHVIPMDEQKVREFVDDMAEQTDTYGKDREFYATVDGWITVPWIDKAAWGDASCYGWLINRKDTVVQLMELIEAGESVTVEPIYETWGTGYTRKTDDIGTTYIEADISEQHMWFYRDNQLIMDYDFVSGLETNSSRRTPRGICKITGHLNGKTLGTYEVQGYSQWVDYWIPFNYLGCGFHDLSRGAYGGNIYMYNGSHGCLNMRLSEVKNLYNEIEDGIPVIVHD
ncbi:MAG: L,D-transpeptidase/peptidoglycan binding protein [Oscillospiraceae bacterium]|nr:L,D-transpeptidase/peptidoglycan binding protein [Oscillospiraceae bacterium]